ncbi:MAG: AAA family ATPase [Anaerolineae bacterium]|nr:AAA family ATPase [Anaerolineae bacterium]
MTQSPFIIGRPLRAHEPLFGREEQLQFIDQSIRKFSCVNIVGERRMGKTSLINRLMAREYPNTVLAFVDLQGIQTEGAFYRKSQIELLAKLSSLDRNLTKLKRQLADQTESTLEIFERTLRSLKERGIRTVLVLDEFEQTLSDHTSFRFPIFFDQLSAMITAEDISMIISSRKILSVYFNDPKRSKSLTSTFPRYFPPTQLKNLDEMEAIELLCQTSDYPLTASEARIAFEWSKGHPCLVQCAGDAWYEGKCEDKPLKEIKEQYLNLQSNACFTREKSNRPDFSWRKKLKEFLIALFWQFPKRIGQVVQRLGLKLDEMAAWVMGMILIIALISLMIGVINHTELGLWFRQIMGLW